MAASLCRHQPNSRRSGQARRQRTKKCFAHFTIWTCLPCHLPPAASDWRITKTRDRWARRKQTQNGIASQWSACQFRSPSAKGKVKISCQADCAIIGFSVLLFFFFISMGKILWAALSLHLFFENYPPVSQNLMKLHGAAPSKFHLHRYPRYFPPQWKQATT